MTRQTADYTSRTVAVFEPNHAAFANIKAALDGVGVVSVRITELGKRWQPCDSDRYDAVLCNFMRSDLAPDHAMASVQKIARASPILGLTINDCAIERTMLLTLGADDAIAAISDRREIAARTLALIRRARLASAGFLACDDLAIDLIGREVCRAGNHIPMPLREFDLLCYLAQSIDQPVTRTKLLRAVWRINFDPGTNRIDVHMSRLRKRIDAGHAHAMLRTVRGVGYALVSRIGASSSASFFLSI